MWYAILIIFSIITILICRSRGKTIVLLNKEIEELKETTSKTKQELDELLDVASQTCYLLNIQHDTVSSQQLKKCNDAISLLNRETDEQKRTIKNYEINNFLLLDKEINEQKKLTIKKSQELDDILRIASQTCDLLSIDCKTVSSMQLVKANKAIIDIISKNEKLLETCAHQENLLKGPTPAFKYLAGMVADYETVTYQAFISRLNWGKNQAREKKIQSLNVIKNSAREQIEAAKIAQYQLAYLIELYPGLQDVIDDNFASVDYSANVPDHDPVRDYLSKDEWASLSESQKNQLALDRYISSHSKSNWQIGRDYELSIGYRFEKDNYSVEYYGEMKGLEDLGRDLICKRDGKTLIIQCKYWSQEKEIHEKHIFQLYGTYITYCLSNKLPSTDVKPVFVTNINCSNMARKVAEHLGVILREQVSFEEFPRIKCDIRQDEYGRNTFIYHLPMDQQYDRIDMTKDAFKVFSVDEAERLGYRRAFKWHGD